ncbi:MAG TPA: hypothetical protein ENK88_05750 [Campylobacterales bacterium]|nr:hypothetical protein [Campylobacterales bacterium]
MKVVSVVMGLSILSTTIVYSDSGWKKDSFKNKAFEEVKIKNRSKKKYDDKVYKYITGHYKVKNNDIELATVHLDNSLQNQDIKVNVITKDLKVEGDSYKNAIKIKRNKYKSFVNRDDNGIGLLGDERYRELGNNNVHSNNSHYSKIKDDESKKLGDTILSERSNPNEIKYDDISELETIDLRNKKGIKEVNVLIEDVDIMVD